MNTNLNEISMKHIAFVFDKSKNANYEEGTKTLINSIKETFDTPEKKKELIKRIVTSCKDKKKETKSLRSEDILRCCFFLIVTKNTKYETILSIDELLTLGKFLSQQNIPSHFPGFEDDVSNLFSYIQFALKAFNADKDIKEIGYGYTELANISLLRYKSKMDQDIIDLYVYVILKYDEHSSLKLALEELLKTCTKDTSLLNEEKVESLVVRLKELCMEVHYATTYVDSLISLAYIYPKKVQDVIDYLPQTQTNSYIKRDYSPELEGLKLYKGILDGEKTTTELINICFRRPRPLLMYAAFKQILKRHKENIEEVKNEDLESIFLIIKKSELDESLAYTKEFHEIKLEKLSLAGLVKSFSNENRHKERTLIFDAICDRYEKSENKTTYGIFDKILERLKHLVIEDGFNWKYYVDCMIKLVAIFPDEKKFVLETLTEISNSKCYWYIKEYIAKEKEALEKS